MSKRKTKKLIIALSLAFSLTMASLSSFDVLSNAGNFGMTTLIAQQAAADLEAVKRDFTFSPAQPKIGDRLEVKTGIKNVSGSNTDAPFLVTVIVIDKDRNVIEKQEQTIQELRAGQEMGVNFTFFTNEKWNVATKIELTVNTGLRALENNFDNNRLSADIKFNTDSCTVTKHEGLIPVEVTVKKGNSSTTHIGSCDGDVIKYPTCGNGAELSSVTYDLDCGIGGRTCGEKNGYLDCVDKKKADLQLITDSSRTYSSPKEGTPGKKIDVVSVITNKGDQTVTGPFDIVLSTGPRELDRFTYNHSPLKKGSEAGIGFEFIIGKDWGEGTHDLKIVIDPVGKIAETNTANNTHMMKLSVKKASSTSTSTPAPQAAIKIEEATVSPDKVKLNDTIAISTKIKNTTSKNITSTFILKAEIDGKEIARTSIGSIKAGEVLTEKIGAYKITDSNWNNSVKTVKITVDGKATTTKTVTIGTPSTQKLTCTVSGSAISSTVGSQSHVVKNKNQCFQNYAITYTCKDSAPAVEKFTKCANGCSNGSCRSASSSNSTGLPDLQVSNLKVSPSSPKVGDTITLSADVKNGGTKDMGRDYEFKFVLLEEEISVKMPSMGPSESKNITRTMTLNKDSFAGSQVVLAIADPIDAIKESNNINNLETLSITIAKKDGSVPQNTSPSGTDPSKHFTDVAPNHWVVKHLKRYVENGILQPGQFKPGHPINRAEAAKIIGCVVEKFDCNKVKAIAYDEVYNDVLKKDNHWFFPFVSYLYFNDIATGFVNDAAPFFRIYKPTSPLKRVEAIKILTSAFNIQVPLSNITSGIFTDVPKGAWFERYVFYAYSKSIVRGYDDGSFKPGANITRAEFIKILDKFQSLK